MIREGTLGGCLGKASYQSHGAANRVIKRVLRRHKRKPAWCGKARLVAYLCRACGHYHVGNDVKEGSHGY